MAGYRKLGLATDQRRAMLRSLVTSFLKHGRIETTETRAKEARSIAEKMITLAKRGDLHARRQVLAYVLEEEVVKTLFDEIAPKYAERNGANKAATVTDLKSKNKFCPTNSIFLLWFSSGKFLIIDFFISAKTPPRASDWDT